MIRCYIDTPDDERDSAPVLHAHHIVGTWNGFVVPACTKNEFARYLDAQGWDYTVVECGRVLLLTDSDSLTDSNSREVFDAVGVDESGATLYAIDGWMWNL